MTHPILPTNNPTPTPSAEAIAELIAVIERSTPQLWPADRRFLALEIYRHFAPLREENERLKEDNEVSTKLQELIWENSLEGDDAYEVEDVLESHYKNWHALRQRITELEAARNNDQRLLERAVRQSANSIRALRAALATHSEGKILGGDDNAPNQTDRLRSTHGDVTPLISSDPTSAAIPATAFEQLPSGLRVIRPAYVEGMLASLQSLENELGKLSALHAATLAKVGVPTPAAETLTPRTDAEAFYEMGGTRALVTARFARTLERELTASRASLSVAEHDARQMFDKAQELTKERDELRAKLSP